MKRFLFFSFLGFFFCSSFGLEKVLYIQAPLAETTTNTYPQEESTGFFIHQILFNNLATLSEWQIVTESPTNTQNILLYRLETTYTLYGPIKRPNCIYRYKLYNEKNILLLDTNTISDIAYGILDAIDVAVFSVGKNLGEDLSRYGIVDLSVPPLDKNYSLYLNKSKILDLTNKDTLSFQYRVVSKKPITFSLREKPSMKNLWLGKTIWETNLILQPAETTTLPIQPMTRLIIKPIQSELLFFPKDSYMLSVYQKTPSTNIFLTNTFVSSRERTLPLPYGRSYHLELTYLPKNLSVATDTLHLYDTRTSYQAIDKKQTRPVYPSIEMSLYTAPLPAPINTISFVQMSFIGYYYLSMNQRLGISYAQAAILNVPEEEQFNNLSTISARYGIYPFHAKYQPFRFSLEFALGWQTAQYKFTITETDSSYAEMENFLNTLMTGPLFEVSSSVELHFLSVGFGWWATQRYNTLQKNNIALLGINLFVKLIL